MTEEDLAAIKQSGYVRNAFGSLGIVSRTPQLVSDGTVVADCEGIYSGDSEIVADRVAQAMGRKGWDVDVWYDKDINSIRIKEKEKEE